MSKRAIYYEEAKRLYVVEGFNEDIIAGMLKNEVTARTIFNWKSDGRWDEKRKERSAKMDDLHEMVLQLAIQAYKQALENPTSRNILAASRALLGLRENEAIKKFLEATKQDGDAPGKTIDPSEIIKLVRQQLEG